MSDHQHHDGHHHHEHHEHGHGDSKDYATANKEHFNNTASNQEHPKWVALAKRSARAILDRYPFDEESTTVMDFACNSGLLSREIAGETKLLIGVDISQTPVDIFNERASNQGIPPEEMRAVCVELKGEEGELDGLMFDVITCAASYHHFEDINSITKTLTFFLKPGGALFVVDVTPKQDSGAGSSSSASSSAGPIFPEQFQHVVAHKHGLSRDAVNGAFDGAGLVSFTFEPITTVTIHQREATLFVAKGTKPPA